jgi:hypothetical protein
MKKISISYLISGFILLLSNLSIGQKEYLSHCVFKKEVRKEFMVKAQYVRRIQFTPEKFPGEEFATKIPKSYIVDHYSRKACYFGVIANPDQKNAYILRRNMAGSESKGKFAYDTTTFNPQTGILRCVDWDSCIVVNDSIYPVWSTSFYQLKCVDSLNFTDRMKINKVFKYKSPVSLRVLVYTNDDEYDKVYAYYVEHVGLFKLTYRINWFSSFVLEDNRSRATLNLTQSINKFILNSYPDPDWYVDKMPDGLNFESDWYQRHELPSEPNFELYRRNFHKF